MPSRPATASAHHLTGADLIDRAYPDRLLKAAEDGRPNPTSRRAPRLRRRRGRTRTRSAGRCSSRWRTRTTGPGGGRRHRARLRPPRKGKGQTALHWAGGRNRMETARAARARRRPLTEGPSAAPPPSLRENGHAAVAAFIEGSTPPPPPKPTPATAKPAPARGARSRARLADAHAAAQPRPVRQAVSGGDAEGGALRPPPQVAGRGRLEPAGAGTAADVVYRRA